MASLASVLTHVVIIIGFHLLYLLLPLASIAVPIVLITNNNAALGVTWIAAYLSWFALTSASERDGKGRPWPAFDNFVLWRQVFEWFPITLVPPTQPLSSNNTYIFGVHPHGGFAFNRAMFGFCTQTLWEPAFPGISFRVLVATAAFRVPVIREFWLWSYCIDASKPTAVKALKNGSSLLLYPGGVKEQLLTERGKQVVFLKTRKGFIKLALQHGCPLVPVYVFGETDLYHHWQLGIGVRKWVADRFGAAIVLLTGSFGLVPYQVPITGVTGPAIPVEQVDDPTQKQIDDLHTKYMQALRKLFDDSKKNYGYADAVLEIL